MRGEEKMLRVIKSVICVCFTSIVVLIVIPVFSIAEEKNLVTYEKDVKPIISKGCLSCHGSDSPTIDGFEKDKEGFKQKNKGPRMDTYENLMIFINGKEAGALMRRLDDGKNTKDRNPGNMFKNFGKTDSERAMNLEVFKNWIGGWTLKRKAEMSEEDLKGIKAKEK